VLYSKFSIGDDRYVIAINQILVIVPYVSLKSIPSLPDYAAGLLNYHGDSIPVIDICQLLVGRPCPRKLSSRIIVTTIKSNYDGEITIGFLVEHATETITVDDDEFIDPRMSNPDMPFIGLVTNSEDGIITRIHPQNIFERLDERLFFPETLGAKEC